MPDHVHVFLQVKERMEKPLGYYIGGIKQNIAKEYSEKTNQRVLSKDIFEENFTDKIVYLKRDFNIIFQYIQQNPQRLAMVKINRDFYNRRPAFVLDGIEYEGYGNHYLMDNPFKKNVWVHGNASDKEKKDLMEECLYQSFGGGVLVSAFISKDEKNIRDEAEKIGGKIILVQKDPFPEKYKPADHNFRLCSQGKLLIIAPKVSFGKNLNREICRKMNLLAEKIATQM